jgi:hypothetical protein
LRRSGSPGGAALRRAPAMTSMAQPRVLVKLVISPERQPDLAAGTIRRDLLAIQADSASMARRR